MSAMFKITSPQDIAMEYGGNKQKIAKAAQNGIISATDAVLAGMFIDRTRNAATEEGQSQTVADEVFAPQQSNVGAAPAAGQGVPSTQPTPAPGVAPTPQLAQAPMPQGMADGGDVEDRAIRMPGAGFRGGIDPEFNYNFRPIDVPVTQQTVDQDLQKIDLGPMFSPGMPTKGGIFGKIFAQMGDKLRGQIASQTTPAESIEDYEYDPRQQRMVLKQSAMGGGINALDVPSAMYDYAPGGLVAFAAGDPVTSDVRGAIDDTYEKLIKAAKSPKEREEATQWYQNALLSARETATEFVNSQRPSIADTIATIPEGAEELPQEPMYSPRPSSALPEGRSTPLVDMDALMGKRTQEAQAQGEPWSLALPKAGSELSSFELAQLERQGGKLPPEIQQIIASETDPLAGFDNPSIEGASGSNPLSGVYNYLFDPTQRKAANMARMERQQMTGQYPIDPDALGEDMNNPLVQTLQAQQAPQQPPATSGLSAIAPAGATAMADVERQQMTGSGLGATLAGQERLQMTGEPNVANAAQNATAAFINQGTPEETVAKVTKASGFGANMDELLKQFEPEKFEDFQAKMLKMMEPEAKGQYRQEMEALINDRATRLEEGKKEAFNFGLIRAGLGMLAQGGGQTALQALGKAATPAIDSYVKEVKELKKEDRELLKLGLAMEQMDAKEKNALKRVLGEAYTKERVSKITARANFLNTQMGRSADNRLLDELGPEGYVEYKKSLAASGTEAGAAAKGETNYQTALKNWNAGYNDAVTAELSTAKLAMKGIKPNDAQAVAAEKQRLEQAYMTRYPKPSRADFTTATTATAATAAPAAAPQGTVVQPQAQGAPAAPAKSAFSPKGAGTATAPFQLTSKPSPQNLKDGKFYSIAGKRYQWDATAQKFNPK